MHVLLCVRVRGLSVSQGQCGVTPNVRGRCHAYHEDVTADVDLEPVGVAQGPEAQKRAADDVDNAAQDGDVAAHGEPRVREGLLELRDEGGDRLRARLEDAAVCSRGWGAWTSG